jgi:hypothetical protein
MSDVDHGTSCIIYCTYNDHLFSIDEKFFSKKIRKKRNKVERGISEIRSLPNGKTLNTRRRETCN